LSNPPLITPYCAIWQVGVELMTKFVVGAATVAVVVIVTCPVATYEHAAEILLADQFAMKDIVDTASRLCR
jgi:hypothetical protein